MLVNGEGAEAMLGRAPGLVGGALGATEHADRAPEARAPRNRALVGLLLLYRADGLERWHGHRWATSSTTTSFSGRQMGRCGGQGDSGESVHVWVNDMGAGERRGWAWGRQAHVARQRRKRGAGAVAAVCVCVRACVAYVAYYIRLLC